MKMSDELWRKYAPKYCPNCANPLPFEPHNVQLEIDTEYPRGGYDCYCDFCEWSGDIEPDSLVDIEIEETGGK